MIAELVGDIQAVMVRLEGVLEHMDRTEKSYQDTASSLNQAGAAYRAAVDDMLARVRVEFEALVTKVTEHAASTVVTQQTAVLERAALTAIRQSLTRERVQRTRDDWTRLCLVAAGVGSGAATLVCAVIWGVVSYSLTH